ncbi:MULTISPECIES: hypothetical protein [unclassified Rhizobium]|uniref:hypothetical protein n=1 Tax=unclassified Rhizobium TaxID=2613769 RepID=UPI00160A776C|nr:MULTISPECIES: hypothetical protein [unclassified Rhizobium]MBB3542346.1 hypothetical protein [Rhizobium sp. BK399]MCS4093052.1 hypothetical protein [Rhizobium sp. BK176]
MEAPRYSLHKNLNIYWTVFDDMTGKKAALDGFFMDMVSIDEGRELVGMLNRRGSEDDSPPDAYLAALTGLSWPTHHQDLIGQRYAVSTPDFAAVTIN